MNTNKHELTEKYFYKLRRRSWEINKELRDIQWIELEEPFQRGWEISWHLREDLTRRKDVDFLYEKLKMAFVPHRLTRSVKELKMIRSGIKGYSEIRDHKKVYVTLGPDRVHWKQKDYEQLDEMRKSWFVIDQFDSWYYEGKRHRVYLPDHMLVLKARPHIITHLPLINSALESESTLIWKALQVYNRRFHRWRENYPAGRKRMETRMAIAKFMKGEADEIVVGRSQLY